VKFSEQDFLFEIQKIETLIEKMTQSRVQRHGQFYKMIERSESLILGVLGTLVILGIRL